MGCNGNNNGNNNGEFTLGIQPTRVQRHQVLTCADVQGCLICPEDIGLLRATQSNTISDPFGIGGLAPGGTVVVTLPALGQMYCLSVGLESSNGVLVATDSYTLTVTRAGAVVATYVRQELAPATANSQVAASCPCSICVGPIQAVTLTLTNTGAAAYGAGAVVRFKLCRDFGPMPSVMLDQACRTSKRC